MLRAGRKLEQHGGDAQFRGHVEADRGRGAANEEI